MEDGAVQEHRVLGGQHPVCGRRRDVAGAVHCVWAYTMFAAHCMGTQWDSTRLCGGHTVFSRTAPLYTVYNGAVRENRVSGGRGGRGGTLRRRRSGAVEDVTYWGSGVCGGSDF